MNVGHELRQARQQAGLSREEISQTTKIQLAKLEALEENAFERLPDGIYLDGIVRTYARTIGLDGDAMAQRVRAARALRADETADAMVSPLPSNEISSGYSAADLPHTYLDEFDSEVAHDQGAVIASQPADLTVAHDQGPVIAPQPVDLTYDDPRDMFAASHPFVPPPSPPRQGAGRLALVVLALLAAAGLGGYLFETARRSSNLGPSGATAAAPANEDAARTSGRSGNSGDVGAAAATNLSRGEPLPDAASPDESAALTAGRSAERESATPPGAASAESAPSAPSAPGALGAPGASGAPGAVPPALDLSGLWTLDTRVESSSVREFEGLQLGYRLEIHQQGARVSGTGVKTLENGRTLGSAAQTPILVQGTIEGKRVMLTFTERGVRRTSDGKMILDVIDYGVLRGRFSSNAARSTGLVEARRPGD